jgi:hypothetical protein
VGVAVPAATPVTTPLVALTVAIAVLLDDHVPPVTVEAKVVVAPVNTVGVPERVPDVGGAETVTVLVAVASAQPPEPATVYEMVVVPAATPVTRPDELTVATPVALDVQVPPDVPEEVNCEVPATQIACVPDNVPAFGAAVTVTVLVTVASEQPELVLVYVIVAVPAATPVTTPVVALTVAIAVLLLDQVPPVTVEAKVEVEAAQISCVPDNTPALGGAVTVIDFVTAKFVQEASPDKV